MAAASVSAYFLLADINPAPDEVRGVSFGRSLDAPAALETKEHALSDGGTFEMEALPVKKIIAGNEISMYGYNGQIPGPTLRVRQGSSLTVNFKNGLDVDTTVHWHGLRLRNEFDGVPGVTQDAVGPGEKFTYVLDFPDAGVYWYHPHVREDFQQEMGLYGNIIVEPRDPNYYNGADSEEAMILDDVRIRNGDLDFFSDEYVSYALMGRFGNVMLANGREDYGLSVGRGEKVRLYVTNAANTRVFNVSIEGQEMALVGDDSGRYERDAVADSFVIAPSERRIVEVLFDRPGTYRIFHRTPESEYVMGSVVVSDKTKAGRAVHELSPSPDIRGEVASIGDYLNGAPDIEMSLESRLSGMMGRMSGGSAGHIMPDGSMMGGSMEEEESGPIEWEDEMAMMNSMSNTENTKWIIRDAKTGKENDNLVYDAKVGDLRKIRIFNNPDSAHPMQHPIHLHGQRFLVLDKDGTPNNNLAWKDTVLVERGSYVDLLVDFKNPGDWLVHCHIPEHMESGMMATFKVSA